MIPPPIAAADCAALGPKGRGRRGRRNRWWDDPPVVPPLAAIRPSMPTAGGGMTRRLATGMLMVALLAPMAPAASACCCAAPSVLAVMSSSCCGALPGLMAEVSCAAVAGDEQDTARLGEGRFTRQSFLRVAVSTPISASARARHSRIFGLAAAHPPRTTPHAVSLPLRL